MTDTHYLLLLAVSLATSAYLFALVVSAKYDLKLESQKHWRTATQFEDFRRLSKVIRRPHRHGAKGLRYECNKCAKWLPVEAFGISRTRTDGSGRHPRCKACRRIWERRVTVPSYSGFNDMRGAN